ENNGYAYSTPVAKQSKVQDFAKRAEGYGMPGVIVDGNDVAAVYRATTQAVDRARSGKGPTLIEAKTFRMKGHAEHDAAAYVPKKILESWERKDPIARFEKLLVKKSWLPAAKKTEIEDRIRKEISEDLAFAETSPMPEGKLALEGVFAE